MTRPVRLRASQRRALARDAWRIPCPACGRRSLRTFGTTVPVLLSCTKCPIVLDIPATPVFESHPIDRGRNARTVLAGFTIGGRPS